MKSVVVRSSVNGHVIEARWRVPFGASVGDVIAAHAVAHRLNSRKAFSSTRVLFEPEPDDLETVAPMPFGRLTWFRFLMLGDDVCFKDDDGMPHCGVLDSVRSEVHPSTRRAWDQLDFGTLFRSLDDTAMVMVDGKLSTVPVLQLEPPDGVLGEAGHYPNPALVERIAQQTGSYEVAQQTYEEISAEAVLALMERYGMAVKPAVQKVGWWIGTNGVICKAAPSLPAVVAAIAQEASDRKNDN